MTSVLILVVIFSFLGITSYIGEKERTKRQKMKIEATLRQEEMARGYAPGTFSFLGDDDDASSTPHRNKMTREELEKGIADLDERLKNLDSIMKNKNK